MVADAAIAAEVASEVATEQSVAGPVPDAVVAALPGVEAGDRCRKPRIVTMGAAYRASKSDKVKPPVWVANKLAVEVRRRAAPRLADYADDMHIHNLR